MGERGRTQESKAIREKFIANLKDKCEKSGCEFLDKWSAKNEWLISNKSKGKEKTCLLLIKASTSEKGFWGVNEERFKGMHAISNESAPFLMVIILLKSSGGYIFKGSEFDEIKQDFSYSKGEYKINENYSLSKYGFWDVDDVFKRLDLE